MSQNTSTMMMESVLHYYHDMLLPISKPSPMYISTDLESSVPGNLKSDHAVSPHPSGLLLQDKLPSKTVQLKELCVPAHLNSDSTDLCLSVSPSSSLQFQDTLLSITLQNEKALSWETSTATV